MPPSIQIVKNFVPANANARNVRMARMLRRFISAAKKTIRRPDRKTRRSLNPQSLEAYEIQVLKMSTAIPLAEETAKQPYRMKFHILEIQSLDAYELPMLRMLKMLGAIGAADTIRLLDRTKSHLLKPRWCRQFEAHRIP